MADINDEQQSELVRITGRDENYPCDTVQEDGINKLWTKSTIVPEAIGNLFFIHAVNTTYGQEMNKDGSSTPLEYFINADASYDLLVEGLLFEAFAGGIKIDKFLSLNQELTNGIIVEVKSEDSVFQFLPIKNTQEFDSHFAWGSGRSFEIIFASGNDSLVARYGVTQPFIVKKAGTYASDDYIKVIISDSIAQINSLKFMAVGKKDI